MASSLPPFVCVPVGYGKYSDQSGLLQQESGKVLLESIQSTADLLVDLKVSLSTGDRHRIDAIIAALLESGADLGRQWHGLARVSLKNGRFVAARAAAKRYVAAVPTIQARFEEAVILAETGDPASALAVLDKLPKDFPDAATAAHFRATIAMQLGDREQSAELFRSALSLRPKSGVTWLSYASLMRATDPGSWAAAVLAMEDRVAAWPTMERAPMLFAIGEARHTIGDYSRAFDAYRLGGKIVRTLRAYSRSADQAAADEWKQYPIGSQLTYPVEEPPIFVLGLPRSGTTLIEQILASHSRVAGGGEMAALHLAINATKRRGSVGPETFATDYLSLVRERFGRGGRIVDKTLNVTRYAGLIATAFPDASIIYIRRDAVDAAWSSFRTYFSNGIAWSFDLDDIVNHFRMEFSLLRFWQSQLRERLLVVEYRDLVERPDATIRMILDHCGLDFEPQLLQPDQTRRAVLTASAVQVRYPINTNGLAVAKPYLPYFSEQADALNELMGISAVELLH